ncbi:helicase, partial [Vibrio parahaemolyticus]|nr:helicase [Vibrio parahaemolyticus]
SRPSKFGYWRQDGDDVQWLIHKQEFVKQLRLRRQYKSQLSPLIYKGWFETNEDRRGTLRIIEKKNGSEFDHRFFAFWPEKILSELKEMGIDE